MERLRLENGAEAGPDMSVLDAAEAIERAHGGPLFVRDHDRIIGVLTERDIVEKVLAAGRRPDAVRVSDIMRAGEVGRDGALRYESDRVGLDNDEDGDGIAEVLQGRCEECGLFSLDLEDTAGLLECPDCRGLGMF